eukprot:g6106.t1
MKLIQLCFFPVLLMLVKTSEAQLKKDNASSKPPNSPPKSPSSSASSSQSSNNCDKTTCFTGFKNKPNKASVTCPKKCSFMDCCDIQDDSATKTQVDEMKNCTKSAAVCRKEAAAKLKNTNSKISESEAVSI